MTMWMTRRRGKVHAFGRNQSDTKKNKRVVIVKGNIGVHDYSIFCVVLLFFVMQTLTPANWFIFALLLFLGTMCGQAGGFWRVVNAQKIVFLHTRMGFASSIESTDTIFWWLISSNPNGQCTCSVVHWKALYLNYNNMH